MKKYMEEFKAFIQQGDIVMIAVGLLMALYVEKIVDALLRGVITPIVAAIFGKPDFSYIGFDIGDARISIGLVIGAVIDFVAVALVLYFILRAYNNMKSRTVKEPDAAPAGPTEVELLTEIRDSLRSR
jgi:large conductance mechanosensitive channel